MEAAKKLQSYFISLQREDQPTPEEMLRKVYFTSSSYILPPFLNISHIVFSTNINARLGEECETEEKRKSGHLLSPNQIAS